MAEQFYTILTKIGKEKIANATILGNKINLVKFQVGDGGGNYYNPSENQTKLKNKVWEGHINYIGIDKQNTNWVVVQVVIPSSIGGFMIREAGVLDVSGNLIAIGKYPETYKPIISNGSAKDLTIKMILEVSNMSSISLKLDPTVVLATKQDVQLLSNDFNDFKTKASTQLAHMANDKLSTVTKSESVINLPNSMDGQLSFSLKGRTLKNEVVNSDFNNGTKYWSASPKVSNIVTKNGEVSFIATAKMGQAGQNFKSIIGHKYYVACLVSTTSTSVFLHIPGNDTYYSGLTSYEKKSSVFIASSESSYIMVVDGRSENYDTIKFTKPFIIDLTAIFGIGNEPTEEWCGNNLQWFDGIKSVGELEGNKIEVLSQNKNLAPLFDSNKWNIIFPDHTQVINAKKIKINSLDGTNYFVKIFIPIKSNTYYTVKGDKSNANSSIYIKYRDKSKTIELHSGELENAKYIELILNTSGQIGDCYFENIQLIKSTLDQTYETHKEDKIDILFTHEFGIGSYIDEKGNISYGTKKVILDGNGYLITGSAINTNNTIAFEISCDDVIKISPIKTPPIICNKFNKYILDYLYREDIEGIGVCTRGFRIRINKSKLEPYGFVESDTSTYITAFKALLKVWYDEGNPLVVYYELAEPIVEQLPQPLTLQSFTNGSMVINSAIPPTVEVNYPTSFATGVMQNAEGVKQNRDEITSIYDLLLTMTEEIQNLKNGTTSA